MHWRYGLEHLNDYSKLGSEMIAHLKKTLIDPSYLLDKLIAKFKDNDFSNTEGSLSGPIYTADCLGHNDSREVRK